MREIKFRAFDKVMKTTHKVVQLDFHEQKACVIYNEVFHNWVDFRDIELREFTGLKDTNGVEIYEGDILRFKDLTYKDAPERIGFVQFRNGSFCISTEFSANYAWLNYEREVIGNIYENPELIKTESE